MPHHFSFSGCGFLGIYHLGVAACLKQHVPSLLEDCKIAGASAGSFVACCLLTGCSIDECTRYVLELVNQAESQPILGPLHPRFKLISGLRKNMFQVLPANAFKIATGRLFISLTRCKDLKNIIVSEYESNTELIDAMLCSSFVPLYCGIVPPKYKEDYYCDGGLSDNQPIFDKPTITISPFSGETDICPLDNSSNFMHISICNSSIQLTQENLYRVSIALFPPKSLTMSEICKQGYNDTLQYLQKNGMINCIHHLSITAVSCFQRKDLQREAHDKKEKTEKKPEDDFDCQKCKQKIRKIFFSSLPPHILKVFHSKVTSKQQNILNYISQGKLFEVLTMMITLFIAPADILWASLTSLINNIPKSQQKFEAILKELHFLFFCFMNNFLSKSYRHNKKGFKINECMDTAYSYFHFDNIMEKLLQEQVSQNMNNVPKDDYDSSQNPIAVSSNTEFDVQNLKKNQESPNQAEFPLTYCCSPGIENGSTHNTTNQLHLKTLSDSVKNRFDKEQSKDNVQMNKSETMEANNNQSYQMDLSDFEKDSTMIDKSHLDILSYPVKNCLNKEQSKNKIQVKKSETMEANKEQNDQINLSDFEQGITVTGRPLERSQRDSLHESGHDKEFRSSPNRDTQDKNENMEVHKNQYLLKYKKCNTSIDRLHPEKLPSTPSLFSKSNLENNEENNPKNQMKIVETHKEKHLCEECDLAMNESLIEASVDEHLVDCGIDRKHGCTSDTSQITKSEITEGHLVSQKNETVSSNCEESLLTVDERFLSDQSSCDVKKMCPSKYNTVESNEEKKNRELELSKYDENNEKTNCNISLNYRNVRTLNIQNYAEDTVEIQNESNNIQTGHFLSSIVDYLLAEII